MSSFIKFCEKALTFWGFLCAVLLTIKFFLHIIFNEKTISDDIKVTEEPEEEIQDRFPHPLIAYRFDTTPENCPEVNYIYTENTIIRKFTIRKVDYCNNKVKIGKILFEQKDLTPEDCIKIQYMRPEGAPPEIIAVWTDKYFRKTKYEFKYNGYNGLQSRNKVIYHETPISLLARIFYY